MAVIETWLHQDLQEPVKVNHLDGNLFSNNGNGNRIGVVLTNNGEALASISGTVSGYVVTADGSTVPCTGSKSGNRASILIPAAAYQPGSIFITVFVTDGTTVTTIGAVSTTVMRSRTNAQVDPGSVVTDWTQTINAAMQSVETAAANLGGIVAVPYASITFPVPLGKYTYYNNNLYRCISPIASSESFTAAHWTQVRLGDDVSDLKSALNNISGYGGNLFDPADATDNYRLNNDGSLLATTSGNLCFTSDYIPVTPGYKYYKNSLAESAYFRICYYTSAKTFISGSAYNDNITTAPEGATYARFCGYETFKSEAGLWLLTAVDYVNRAKTDSIEDETDSLSGKMDYLIQNTKNLYNPATKMDGYQLYSNGTPGANADYNFTGYIDISGCEKITVMLYKVQQSAHDGTQNAFYDESKTPVTTRNQLGEITTNDVKTFTVPSGAKYFGIAYAASVMAAEGSTIMVQEGESYTGYEPYGYVIQPSNETVKARGGFGTLGERLDSIAPRDNEHTIVFWGDSLTEGNQANDGGSIPGYMGELLSGWTMYNFGRGGDLANSVACRQGGMAYVVEAGQTIPASGSVTLNLTDNIGSPTVGVRMYDGAVSYDSLNPCYIAGVKGKLLRVSSSYETNKGIFTRETSGSSVSIDRPTEVISNGINYKGYTLVVAIGTNQGFDTSNPQELVNIIRWMIDFAGADKYLVMGLYHTGAAWQRNCNAALKAEFGRHFIDAGAYMKTKIYNGDTLVSSYALADEGITPTETDLTNIANDVYPASIMYDNTHFNKYGYECIAKLQYKRGQDLGYWE